MKLTKLQRYTAYCIMLSEAEKILKAKDNLVPYYKGGSIDGLCDLLCEILHMDIHLLKIMGILGLSELMKFNPKIPYKYYWFADWNDRIAALKQCIKETEPK